MTDALNAKYNMGQDRDLEDSGFRNDIKLKEIKNQVRSTCFKSTNLKEPSKVSENHSSLSHKIFIGLFTVLFLSVIILSFSLYRMDQKLTELKDGQLNHPSRDVIPNKLPEGDIESNGRKGMRKLFAWKKNVTQELKEITKDMKSMKERREKDVEQIKKLDSKVFSIDHVLSRIDKVNATTADLTNSLSALQAWEIEAKKELKAKDELIKKLQNILESALSGIDTEKKTVSELTKVVDTNKDTIKEKSDLITDLQTKSAKSAEDIKDVNAYADQLRMRIQFDEKMKKDLQLEFKKIVKLAGLTDKVSQTDPTLQKLLNQKTSFEKQSAKWGIKYEDILRLISADDFKQKELPVVGKIGTMFDLFTNTYNTKWGIEFKDVIKFTEKSDLADMNLGGNKYLFNSAPKVLLKIDYLYKVFTYTYQSKWLISFKDVFSVTEKLDFEVGATDIPVLTMIGSWFVDNFDEIWGGKTFEDLFHELVKSTEDERNDIQAKLKKLFAWKKNVTQELKEITKDMKSMKERREKLDEQIKKLDSKVFNIDHVQSRIDKVNATTAELKSSLIALQAWEIEAKKELKEKDDLIAKLQGLLKSAQTGIDEEKKTLVDLTKEVDTNKDKIEKKTVLITDLQTKSAKSAKDIKEVSHYADQLRMKLQFDDKMEKKLQLDLKMVVEMTGMKYKVYQTDPTLKKLLNQKVSFDELNKVWGIKYEDILRLISAEDFKQKEIPVLGKIKTMFSLFTYTYNTKWGIEFKDVIRFTEKSDLADIDLVDNKFQSNSIPKVLLKIDYLYKVFTDTYQSKWLISFKDVFSVTEKLDFEVGATDIPVLTMIGSWFVDNFNEIWGGKTFEDLFHELVKSSEDERNDIVAKLKKVSQKNSLHFLPADFEKTGKIVTISGFVKVLVDGVWGTIYKKGQYIDNLVRVVCNQGGYYRDGWYLKDYSQEGSYDRTNETRLVHKALCYGTEHNIKECSQLKFESTTTAWNQIDDVAVKCTL